MCAAVALEETPLKRFRYRTLSNIMESQSDADISCVVFFGTSINLEHVWLMPISAWSVRVSCPSAHSMWPSLAIY